MLDWYTVLVGLLAVSTLITHGANFIAMKTLGPVRVRGVALAQRSGLVTLVLTVLATAATFWLRPGLLVGFTQRPWGSLLPSAALLALLATRWFAYPGRDRWSFAGSGTFVVTMLASTAFVVYPDVLPGVDPSTSLTIDNAAAPPYALTVGLIWWSIALVLATVYFVVVYKLFHGKVELGEQGY